MSDPQEKKEDTQPLPLQSAEREIALDMRLLSEAVIELNISRKNVGIYPPAMSRSRRALSVLTESSRTCSRSGRK